MCYPRNKSLQLITTNRLLTLTLWIKQGLECSSAGCKYRGVSRPSFCVYRHTSSITSIYSCLKHTRCYWRSIYSSLRLTFSLSKLGEVTSNIEYVIDTFYNPSELATIVTNNIDKTFQASSSGWKNCSLIFQASSETLLYSPTTLKHVWSVYLRSKINVLTWIINMRDATIKSKNSLISRSI